MVLCVSRALKCYQKAVQLQPDHVEALSCAGDLLFTAGREVYIIVYMYIQPVYTCTYVCI